MCTSFLAFGCFRGHSFCMVPSKVGKGYCPLRWSLRQDHLRSLRYCYLVCMTTLDVSGCFVKLMSLLWGTLSDSEERADLQRCSSGCCLTVFSWTRLSFLSDQGREQLQRNFSANSFCRMLISHYERTQNHLTRNVLFPFSFCFTTYGLNLRWIFK